MPFANVRERFSRGLLPLARNAAALSLLLAACAPQAGAPEGGPLRVVATTSILGDVVGAVGGDAIELSVMLPLGSDPHSFEPTPQDAAAVADADIIFAVGLNLEPFLQALIENAGGDAQMVTVSEGVAILEAADEHEDEHQDEHDDEGHAHVGADPHVWMDPTNVKIWVENIVAALAGADPENAETYVANAVAYQEELDALDAWAGAEVARLAEGSRVLVTDHEALGYFAARYGFEVVGTVIPGTSTLSEPSAAQLAELEEHIAEFGVRAIFIGFSANPDLSERVAADTGVELVRLYAESLSEPDGPAPTYLDLMRYDVEAIVEALGG